MKHAFLRLIFRAYLLPACAVTVGAATVVFPAPAAAQDCGAWSRPVLCTAQLVAIDDTYQRVGLGQRSRIELAPREQITLELDARDQTNRQFPSERLALGVEAGNCRSMLRVDDRGGGQISVAATSPDGRCTLQVWVPNNLNFFWELEIEVRAAARRSYSRSESEFLATALYAALLNREPDDGGFASSVAEIQSGNLEGLITAMLGSPEFRGVTSGMTPAQILEQFYQGILGREGDSAGVRLYLGEMRRRQYASVLLKLIRSPEFERRLG